MGVNRKAKAILYPYIMNLIETNKKQEIFGINLFRIFRGAKLLLFE